GEPVQLLEARAIVAQRLAVALRVERVDEVRGEVDDVRAVGRRDLLEIPGRTPRDLLLRLVQLAREAREPAAEGRAREDVLAHEARHLVARAAKAALGALERERRLARHELREADRLSDVR